MEDFEIVTKPRAEFNPDVKIDFGENEAVFLQIRTQAKNKERRQLLEDESIRILRKVRAEKEYRIHFDNPFLLLEDEDGNPRVGKKKITGDNMYAVCVEVFRKPSERHTYKDLVKAINKRLAKHSKETYPPEKYGCVSRAVIEINKKAREDFGVKEDILISLEDDKVVFINPAFKKRKA